MIISNGPPPAIEMAKAVASRAAGDAFRERVDDAALHVLRAKEGPGCCPAAADRRARPVCDDAPRARVAPTA